jgi:hypothetical protein
MTALRAGVSLARQWARAGLIALRNGPTTFGQWRRYWSSLEDYARMDMSAKPVDRRYLYPCIGDDTGVTEIEPTYFYQDAWAFERIVNARPAWHLDIGSHHKYVALLSKVVSLTMVDLRPLDLPLDSLSFRAGSILDLPYDSGSVPSVSSLCVIEHIGLGRYGDALDPEGTVKALAELKRVVAPGGDLYVSVPLDDRDRVYFNAHRAFTEPYLESLFAPFDILDRQYIFGKTFGPTIKPGFGTGCYHLRAPTPS